MVHYGALLKLFQGPRIQSLGSVDTLLASREEQKRIREAKRMQYYQSQAASSSQTM